MEPSNHIIKRTRYRTVVARPGLAAGTGIKPLVGLMFNPSRMFVDNQRQLTSAQRLADQDVIEKKRILRGGLIADLIPELCGPAQMAGKIKQGVVEEPLGNQYFSLKIADQVEEKVSGLKVIMARAIIAVTHHQEAWLCQLVEFGRDVLPNITRLGSQFDPSLHRFRHVFAHQVPILVSFDWHLVDL